MSIPELRKDNRFIILNPEGLVTEISEEAEKAFGLDKSMVGLQISNLLHLSDDDAEEKGLIAALEPSPGSLTPVLVRRTLLTGTEVLHLYDLTDPDAYAPSFASASSLPARLVAGLPVGVVVQFQDARILSANAAAVEILGLSLDELLGRTSIDPRWRSIQLDGTPFPGEHHPAMTCLRTGVEAHSIFGVITPLGDRRWLDVKAKPLIMHDGHVIATTASFIDITAEVDGFSETQRAVSRYETLLSECSSHVLICDLLGVISYVAPNSIAPLPQSGIGKIGENFLSCITEDTRMEVLHLFTVLESRRGSKANCTVKLDIFGGSPRWFEISIRNMIDDPKIDGLIITASDVDDRVRDAEQLSALNLELQRRLTERDEEYRVDQELSSAAEMISKCISVSELEAVVVGASNRIFKANKAELYRTADGGGVLHAAGGEGSKSSLINRHECWALRTNQLHHSPSSSLNGLRCSHLGPDDGPSLCVPLGAEPRLFGLLTLSHLSPDTEQHALSFVNRIGPMLSISSGLEA